MKFVLYNKCLLCDLWELFTRSAYPYQSAILAIIFLANNKNEF